MFQVITPPIANRSSGGINFGEVQFSQSKVASTSGLGFAQPTPGRREFHHHIVAHDAQPRAAQEHGPAQGVGLSIWIVGRGLVLVMALQVERAEHGQERRFRRKEWLQAETVSRHIVLQLLDPFFDAGASVVVPLQLQRALAAVGHPYPEGIARHGKESASHRRLDFAAAFVHHHERP